MANVIFTDEVKAVAGRSKSALQKMRNLALAGDQSALLAIVSMQIDGTLGESALMPPSKDQDDGSIHGLPQLPADNPPSILHRGTSGYAVGEKIPFDAMFGVTNSVAADYKMTARPADAVSIDPDTLEITCLRPIDEVVFTAVHKVYPQVTDFASLLGIHKAGSIAAKQDELTGKHVGDVLAFADLFTITGADVTAADFDIKTMRPYPETEGSHLASTTIGSDNSVTLTGEGEVVIIAEMKFSTGRVSARVTIKRITTA